MYVRITRVRQLRCHCLCSHSRFVVLLEIAAPTEIRRVHQHRVDDQRFGAVIGAELETQPSLAFCR